MGKFQWNSAGQLRQLLNELVSWKSISLSEGEKQFPRKLYAKLQDLDYFHKNPSYLNLHEADQRRKLLTALYKHPDARQTICLISHFDTVNTEEYGSLEPLATQPEELTKIYLEQKDTFARDIRADIESGDFLFGRGTMDMKMGLVMHMSLIEQASIEEWPINLVLLTVPDEEVNSAGMRFAIPALINLQKQHDIKYTLFLNSEPTFRHDPKDNTHYIYSGTIGKVLAGALFYGKETHAGEPLSGMTSPFISSFLTREMEWNPIFQETVLGETAPLPVTLQQTDLRLRYSTQTPYRSSALYNIFLLERTVEEAFALFEQTAKKAALQCNERYKQICKDNQVQPIGHVKVIAYRELLEYAGNKLGEEFIEELKKDIHYNDDYDDREKSLRITDSLMIHCQELAPAIVILFAPPYYPAVNSSGNLFVESCVDFVEKEAKREFQLEIKRSHFLNGICDLSYVNYQGSDTDLQVYEENTPVWGDSYELPFSSMRELNAPVLNVGPFGHDAHKRTERLHITNAFEQFPYLIRQLILQISQKEDN
ncbi:M20/M25/M40 family metallo-hydrolase [Oceanobacillus sojae]|uniref:M20/M25/M40 family metallo-hydrolase n=1 Tax=Oceanobacillus sojae TaxID=582851 RepID=UPI0009883F68|nr:M20/M25/M40 family metallo-hydrolase [Oceanobacillus sojae]MCT1903463.1 M20/M25/M40 family metallo-hydrolase [Oceanobacillus sojae]